MKILITGATGLLGTDIAYTLELYGHKTFKACYSNKGKDFITADITTKNGIQKLDSINWDCVIHTAAWKDPDKCEEHKKSAFRINVWSTEQIAALAARKKAKIFFISTDYVFSGKNPPYHENSEKDPINYYGETKATAENKIQEITDYFCILRVPVLYGIRAGLKASALLYSSVAALKEKKEKAIDNYAIRYPTYTGDVADAVSFLIKKNAEGIFHFSGNDKTTKYGIVKTIAEILNIKMDFIKNVDEKPDISATRPFDSHLSMNKLLSIGFEQQNSFKKNLETIINQNPKTFAF